MSEPRPAQEVEAGAVGNESCLPHLQKCNLVDSEKEGLVNYGEREEKESVVEIEESRNMKESILEGENGDKSEEEKKIEDSNEADVNDIALSKADDAKPTDDEDGNLMDKTAENIEGENTEDMHVDMEKAAENIQGEFTEDMNVDKDIHTEESKHQTVEDNVVAKAEHSEVLNEEDSKGEISKDEGENDVEREDSMEVNAEDGKAISKGANSNDVEKVNLKDENAKDGECKDVESVNSESAKEEDAKVVKMVDDGDIKGKNGSEDETEEGKSKNEEEIDMKHEAANENSDKKVNGDEDKGSEKKRSTGQKESHKGDGKEAKDGGSKVKLSSPIASSTMERPVRERKAVARFVEVIENDPGKELKIEKGHGTPLRDIPNVAYRIARKKPMELKLIHYILFGRGGKYCDFKSHLLQFSGFVWLENEEKGSAKIKEKLDKLVKNTLLDLCDFFDISDSRANSKKEDLITKLLDFLIAPHATTDVLLSEKEQLSAKTKKRKRMAVGSASKVKLGTPTKLSRKKQSKSGDSATAKGSSDEETEEEDNDDDDGENGYHDVSNKGKADSTMKKSTPKSDTKEKDSGKKLARGKSNAVEAETPSEKELRIKICKLLKEVDFNTATFADIFEQLAAHFKMDLTPRRASVKLLIQEELTKMAEEAEDGEDDSSDDESTKPAAKKG